MKKLLSVLSLLLITFTTEFFSLNKWNREIVVYDVAGYYMYLPAVFIYKDLPRLGYYDYVEEHYHPSREKGYAIFPQAATGRKVIKYPMGVAIGEMPLFLLAHAYAKCSTGYKADGYSVPYKVAITCSSLLSALLGLFFLGRFLLSYFDENTAAWTVLIIGIGTNLYAYTLFDAGMSHAWLFLLFSLILYASGQLYHTQKPVYAYGIGVLAGLIMISRPIDVAVVLVPVLMGLVRKEQLAFLRRNKLHILGAVAVAMAIISLQLAYWKYTSGHWLHFSYQGEGFDFSYPHVIEGLFSYRKGWFVYTPIALLSVMGLVFLYQHDRFMALIVLLFTMVMMYLVFSWTPWYYGWGFGCRPMVEVMAVLSIPLAALIRIIARQSSRLLKNLAVVLFFFLIGLNIFQTYQYHICVLQGDGVTKAYYWRIWAKLEATDEDRRHLRY